MSAPILKTKLFVPPVSHEFVARPRLIERLNAGLHRKLTLVSAPAGFGKTTLLSEWAHEHGRITSSGSANVAWLSLDRDDNEQTSFWIYFITALQALRPELGTLLLPVLETAKSSEVESVLTLLINELADESERRFLILDDYHTIENDGIHDALGFLLVHMPPQLHLVVASRTDPPLPLARFRGKGQLNVISTTDLRFTPDEIATFLNDVMNLGLSVENLSVLEDRTEGWIASLQMAAISMKERDDISGFVNAFSGSQHHILDYLTEEVLNRQPSDVQTFLLKTSILERLTASLANFVTGGDDAQQMIDQMEASNLFLIPLDEKRNWLRYHHLFADLLRDKLNKSDPDLPPILHRRASEWFEREGLTAESIDHALAAGDFQQAADLLEAVAVPMITMESKVSTIMSWFNKLPNDLIIVRPWLCICMASAHLAAGRPDAVEPLLEAAEAVVEDSKGHRSDVFPDSDRILGLAAALRANAFCVQGDLQRALELSEQALTQLPEDEVVARTPLSLNLGVAHAVQGQLSMAGRYFQEAVELGKKASNLYIALIAMSCLADTQAKQGNLHQASETNRMALQLGNDWSTDDEPLAATSYAHIGLAKILYEWDELPDAAWHITRGLELSAQAGDALIVLLGYHDLTRIGEFLGKTGAVAEALERTRSVLSESQRVLLSAMADAWQAHLCLARGDVDNAQRWAALQGEDLNLEEVPDYWQEFSYLTLIRLQIARGETDKVPKELEGILRKARIEGRVGRVIEVLILQSIALQTCNQTERALEIMEKALSLAEAEGYIRTFADEGETVRYLLRQLNIREGSKDYVKRILRAIDLPFIPAGSPEGSGADRILSPREQEVLQLMADGASTKEMADSLIVSVSTIKTHVKNIYSKLDVHKQTAAVTRARELGLLS